MTSNTPGPDYRRASFILSAAQRSHFPPDEGAEVAFVGRSNSGKSSAISTLCDQHKLARASRTPGRTQQINFFALSDTQRLVDLPGYGFARVPAAMRRAWTQLMQSYLTQRRSLAGIVIVMDIRHPLQPPDRKLIEQIAPLGHPLLILLTKADKLKRGAAMATVLATRRELDRMPQASVQLFSSLSKAGVNEAHAILDHWYTNAETR